MYPTLIINKGNIVNVPTDVRQLEISDITICPALILAINRTVNVKGRINVLTVSTNTKKGIKAPGAPAGAKWAADSLGNFTHPDNNNLNHKTNANLLAVHSELVLLYVRGVKPIKFIWTKKNIKLNKNKGSGRIFFWLVSLDDESLNLAKEIGVIFQEDLKKNLEVINNGKSQTIYLSTPNWLQSREENKSAIINSGV